MSDQQFFFSGLLLSILLFTACAPPVETDLEQSVAVKVESPIGHYGKGPMDLWIREDSLFILREAGGDTEASGRFGRWRVIGDRLILDVRENAEYMFVENGIKRTAPEGPFPSSLDRTDRPEEKLAVMRMIGAYRSLDGSHSFTPCGTERAFPLAVGDHVEELTAAHSEAMRDQELPVFMEIDASIAPGPAMAGDGEEEYVWLERVGPILTDQRCPF